MEGHAGNARPAVFCILSAKRLVAVEQTMPSLCSEHLGDLKPPEFLHTRHIHEAL